MPTPVCMSQRTRLLVQQGPIVAFDDGDVIRKSAEFFFFMFSQAALRIAKGIQTMFIKSGQDQPLSHAMVKGQF